MNGPKVSLENYLSWRFCNVIPSFIKLLNGQTTQNVHGIISLISGFNVEKSTQKKRGGRRGDENGFLGIVRKGGGKNH